jgi:hypothetical protein
VVAPKKLARAAQDLCGRAQKMKVRFRTVKVRTSKNEILQLNGAANSARLVPVDWNQLPRLYPPEKVRKLPRKCVNSLPRRDAVRSQSLTVVDLHARQTIAMVDTETGEFTGKTLFTKGMW